MSDLEHEKVGSTGIKIPRFQGDCGEDYGLWCSRFRALCCLKGVWDVVEHSIDESSETTTLSVPEARLFAKLEKASGIIVSALGHAPLRVISGAEDEPSRMISLLDSR